MKQQIKEQIAEYLGEPAVADKIFVFEELDSTNGEAKRRIRDGAASGTVILANHQTAGRGRMGRSFYSPKDSGIYFSMILRPNLPTEELVQITTAASVAVCRAVRTVCGAELSIKWVNDLYQNGKKVCGILAEAVGSAVILGIGINCTTRFDGELAKIAGSLNLQSERKKICLIAELIRQIGGLEDAMINQNWQEEYRSRSMLIGKTVFIVAEPETDYTVLGIGEKGELCLADQEGRSRILNSGEVSIRLRDGMK